MFPSYIDLSKVSSPCFLMDERKLIHNAETIQDVAQKSGAKIILALKGFSMWSTFSALKKYIPGTTASSLNEARLAYEEFGGEVHAYCVAYMDNEFDDMMRYCDHITFNSINQFQKFKPKLLKSTKHITCGLRINPEYSETEVDLYNPCIPGSRLGTTKNQIPEMLPEGIEGLHSHTLCEKDSYALERTWYAIEKNFGTLLKNIKWLNLGGGHLITRAGYDKAHLIHLIQNIYASYPNIKEIILEPGSAFAWQTGYLVSSVQDIVESGGKKVAVLDVSVSAHMPDCIEMPYTAQIYGAEIKDSGNHVYKVGGLTCLAGDHMGPYAFEKPLQPGDKVIFDDMMHYTMVKTTMFNGVNHPDIGIWKTDDSYQIIRHFGYDDFKSRLS